MGRAKKCQRLDLRSNASVHGQLSCFKRVDMIVINLGCPNGTVLAGDLRGVGVGIYVSFDNQLPSLFVDSAKITGLVFVWERGEGREGRRSTHWKQTKQGATRCLRGFFWVGPNWAILWPPS